MKMVILVPYRDRAEHLKVFIPYLKFFLKSKNIDNVIHVIEQNDDKLFNKGKILNIGFDLYKNEGDYICFHDIDMIPFIADYSPPTEGPTHLAVEVEQFNFKMPYPGYFGGVVLFKKEWVEQMNGWSNEFWGWGAEDDDFRERCLREKFPLYARRGIYKSLSHKHNGDRDGVVPDHVQKNRDRIAILRKSMTYHRQEGLTTLKYSVDSVEQKEDFILTKVKV